MKQPTFGSRLSELIKEQNMKANEFVDSFNSKYPDDPLSEATVSRYKSGIHRPKRFETTQNIAEFFGVTVSYLMCKSDDKYGEDVKFIEVPVLGTIAAGLPILAQEDIQGREYINPHDDIDFCLKVKGDSMTGARIFDGDTVFVRYQPEVENGEIAAVQIDGEEATLKRVYYMRGGIVLHSENPIYADIIFEKKDKKIVQILGKAVYFKSKVR